MRILLATQNYENLKVVKPKLYDYLKEKKLLYSEYEDLTRDKSIYYYVINVKKIEDIRLIATISQKLELRMFYDTMQIKIEE